MIDLDSRLDWLVTCPPQGRSMRHVCCRPMHIIVVTIRGPSIYDVHTEGDQGQMDACGRGNGGGGQAPCGRPHRILKLEPTDVILSSSHAKKLVYF